MQQLHISPQLFNFGYDITHMNSTMRRYYSNLVKIPQSYFSALGRTLVRDLLLPYCQGVAKPELTYCERIPSEIVATMLDSDKYTVCCTTKNCAILSAKERPERIIINYRTTPQYIELPYGTTARMISNNVVLTSNGGPQHLIYICEKVLCLPVRGNAKNEYFRWGAHGIRIDIRENADLFDGVIHLPPKERVTTVYYEFRAEVYFWRS